MAVINYVKHRFQNPGVLTLDQYHQLKQLWSTDPAYNPGRLSKATFTYYFRKRLWWIVGCALVCLVAIPLYLHLFPEKPNGLEWDRVALVGPAILAGLIGFFILAQLLLEGPSYATFLADRQRYYSQLAVAVQASRDYHSFTQQFYPYVPGNKPARKLTAATGTGDRFLTALFHWIDKHMWKVFLLVLALWLLNKYVFRISF
ncbi:hypothetical protein [Paraflavitalea pollutisoli]|uniref:hypothetical protein n=1 Tax=Paraflavitalea pollutisoli TaxID=3034143 RepID=UPI0023EB9C46|nr:hypothetical protein [Paraflavitalea sp. H1-2-19X]